MPQHLTDHLWRTWRSDIPYLLPLDPRENRHPHQTDYEAMPRGKTDARKPRTTALREENHAKHPKRVCNGNEKHERKNNGPRTHIRAKKTDDRRAKEKTTLPTKTHEKQKKRASSHGDRGTLGQHAAVKQGTWPTATLIIHSLAVIAPRSPRIALLGRRALASPRTRYPFSPFITSPINASDR